MPPRLGYLLPTREGVMEGNVAAAPLLRLAERAEALGYDSVWIGDSLFDRPRHEPLVMLAGVAARTRRLLLGTGVLLPALRNPVQLAHQVATLDQIAEGRVILGIGISPDQPGIRAEFAAVGVPFEKRVGRVLESMRLCRALWTGQPVSWDGRWHLENIVLGPTPHRTGGPPIWMGGNTTGAMERAARVFDGWFPISPSPERLADDWRQAQAMRAAAGRAHDPFDAAIYMTIFTDDDPARAEARIGAFLEAYYPGRGEMMKRNQAWVGGPRAAVAERLARYAAAGVTHFVLRFAGEHERQLELVAQIRAELGW
ncbi:MAG TPA: LLM class flavin-dependent oxidoreductase [Stellaceae bacterium]|nr:LLM class flavin-dependent oxidoreductase [Stellaceae bacterium]